MSVLAILVWHFLFIGSHLSPTKRRVTFKFGLASLPHLGLGKSGPEARGFEHVVILLWSLASGKRRILLDGREVHFSCGPIGQNSFSANFPLPGAGNHQMQLVADLTTGGSLARAQNPSTYGHYKHFDLRLSGQSFHDMLHIYELGGPKCRNMYSQAMAYAESLPREQLEQTARNIGTARGEDGAIRRAVPDRIVEHYEDATYATAGEMESSGVPDFDTITPRDRVEEKFMYEFARQKSVRNGASAGGARSQHQQQLHQYSRPMPSAPPQPSVREQIPTFRAVHGAFRSEPPQRAMRTIDESEDLIDLSSSHPSSSQNVASPPGVTRTPSDITIDLPDVTDDVSAIGDDASVVGGYGRGPTLPASMMRGESTRSFAYAPAPTFEDAVSAFGAGANYGQVSTATSGVFQQQAPPPPSFAVPPPPSVAPPSTYAPTDASFAARAQPNMPGSGASFAFAPAPRWEEIAAQFGSYIPQPQQQQPSYAATTAATTTHTANPFSPTFAG